MDNTICYLNTDLVLISDSDLTELADALNAHKLHLMGHAVVQGDDGRSYANFETREQHSEPEANIAAMLDVVESLPAPLRSAWDACVLREFNIGYDCGADPWAFNQGLSATLLNRVAAARGSLRITLYPDRDGESAPK
jgi:hypothetical protein